MSEGGSQAGGTRGEYFRLAHILWCEVVDGNLPDDVWNPFVRLFEGAGANTRPTVTEPVAFSLACLLGSGPSADFPFVPEAWRRAAMEHDGTQDLVVPDDLFALVFPD